MDLLAGGNSNIFYFHPIPGGKIPILTSIFFQWGWFNHQLENLVNFHWLVGDPRGPFITHTIHVGYIYLHLLDIFMVNVGKYTSPMDAMGKDPMTSMAIPVSSKAFRVGGPADDRRSRRRWVPRDPGPGGPRGRRNGWKRVFRGKFPWFLLFLVWGCKTPFLCGIFFLPFGLGNFGRLFRKILPLLCVFLEERDLGGLEVHESKVRHDIPFYWLVYI